MQNTDGNEIRGTKENIIIVSCTRWKELQRSVEYHIELAGLIEATTIFRMLNDPGHHIGPQEFSIGRHDTSNGCNTISNNNKYDIEESKQQIEHDVSKAIRIIQQTTPNGVTPLTQHIRTIIERIRVIESSIREQGQKVVVVIATDGLPSDAHGHTSDTITKEFVTSLKELQTLPVWVVIRLCTSDDTVTDFYNDLDKKGCCWA